MSSAAPNAVTSTARTRTGAVAPSPRSDLSPLTITERLLARTPAERQKVWDRVDAAYKHRAEEPWLAWIDRELDQQLLRLERPRKRPRRQPTLPYGAAKQAVIDTIFDKSLIPELGATFTVTDVAERVPRVSRTYVFDILCWLSATGQLVGFNRRGKRYFMRADRS